MKEQIATHQVVNEPGFYQPTILIESQSAPALKGIAAEQKYMRAFVLAKETDLVVTDFPLNHTYIQHYLKDTLHFSLPQFVVVPNLQMGTLSENLISNPESQKKILNWAQERNDKVKIQFFNVTENEKNLLNALDIPSTNGDIENTLIIGSKTGFRRFSDQVGLPMPRGYICSNVEDTARALEDMFKYSDTVLIKSENGTGGTDLKSNILIRGEDVNGNIKTFAKNKLAEFDGVLGDEWVVEEFVDGKDGSVHVFINDAYTSEKAFVLGAISVDNSYAGGYSPCEIDQETSTLIELVDNVAIPSLQKLGVFGYHCFDFKGDKFLENNARPGALDFINGFVKRVASLHFPGEIYAYYHRHVSIPKPTSFEIVWDLLSPKMDPGLIKENNLLIVSNQEVLPFGRSLDLTTVTFGDRCTLIGAKKYFEEVQKYIQENL